MINKHTTILLTTILLTLRLSAQTPTLVKDISSGSSGGVPFFTNSTLAYYNTPTEMNGVLYFVADDGLHEAELWRTDGTTDGTQIVKDINTFAPSQPTRLLAMNGMLLFFADDGDYGDELWRSDGTESGTQLVKDINTGFNHAIRRNYGQQRQDWAVIDNVLYFVADVSNDYAQLWRSDGTSAGTTFVADVCFLCNANNFGVNWFSVLGDTLYFLSQGDLWRSNGTAATTIKVYDNSDPGKPILAQSMQAVNGKLYISGGSDVFSPDLWVSDGTSAGTVEILNTPDYGLPRSFVSAGGKVYFISGDKVWVTDGTAAGTAVAAPVPVDYLQNKGNNLFAWDDKVFFVGIGPGSDGYLYAIDPAANDALTEIQLQNSLTPLYYDPIFYAAGGGRLYYNGLNYQHTPFYLIGSVGEDLANPSIAYLEEEPYNLFFFDDKLFFTGNSSEYGRELYVLDPTSGTAAPPPGLALKLSPNPASAYVTVSRQELSAATGRLRLFHADGSLAWEGVSAGLETHISVASLPPGFYRLEYSDGNRWGSEKIIIAR